MRALEWSQGHGLEVVQHDLQQLPGALKVSALSPVQWTVSYLLSLYIQDPETSEEFHTLVFKKQPVWQHVLQMK